MIYEFACELLNTFRIGEDNFQIVFLFNTGDNLAIHQASGLYEAFTAIYSCLYCMVPKNELNVTYIERFDTLRTALGTEKQIQLINATSNNMERKKMYHFQMYFDIINTMFLGVLNLA